MDLPKRIFVSKTHRGELIQMCSQNSLIDWWDEEDELLKAHVISRAKEELLHGVCNKPYEFADERPMRLQSLVKLFIEKCLDEQTCMYIDRQSRQISKDEMIAAAAASVYKPAQIRAHINWDISNDLDPHFPLSTFVDVGLPTPDSKSWKTFEVKKLKPPDFIYSNTLDTSSCDEVMSQVVGIDDFQICCDCVNECDETTCKCLLLSAQLSRTTSFPNGMMGRALLDNVGSLLHSAVVMCGPKCACHKTPTENVCKHSFTRNIPAAKRFEVFKRDERLGFGVRTLVPIEEGTMLMEFSGVLNTPTSMEDDDMAYSFDVTPTDDSDLDHLLRISTLPLGVQNYKWVSYFNQLKVLGGKVFVNPFREGNISRFLTHGCLPNCTILRVICNDLQPHKHHLIITSCLPIPAGSELFFDYGAAASTHFDAHCCCETLFCQSHPLFDRLGLLGEQALLAALTNYRDGLLSIVREQEKKLKNLISDHGADTAWELVRDWTERKTFLVLKGTVAEFKGECEKNRQARLEKEANGDEGWTILRDSAGSVVPPEKHWPLIRYMPQWNAYSRQRENEARDKKKKAAEEAVAAEMEGQQDQIGRKRKI